MTSKNGSRPHSSLDQKTPDQFYFEQFKFYKPG